MNNQFLKIDFVDAINDSWRIFKENLGMAIAGAILAQVASTALVMFVVAGAFGLFALGVPLIALINKGGANSPEPLIIGGIIVCLVIVLPIVIIAQIFASVVIGAGLLSFFIQLVKDEKSSGLNKLLVFDSRLWHLFLYQMLFSFISLALVLIPLAPGGILLGLAATMKFSFIPGILLSILGVLIMIALIVYLNLALFQSPYFIIDKRVGPVTAMTLSVEAMKGNKFGLLCIQLIFAAIALVLNNLTGGIGMIFLFPLLLIAYAKVYVTIVGEGFIPEQLEIEHQNKVMKKSI